MHINDVADNPCKRKKVCLKNEIVMPQTRLQTQVAKQDFSCQRKTKLAKSRPVVITVPKTTFGKRNFRQTY